MLQRDRRARICANGSPGATRSSSTPRPGRTSRPISCWIGGGPRPARHLARRRHRHRSAGRREGIGIRVVEVGEMGERDVVTEEPRLGHLGDHATFPPLRTGIGVDAQTASRTRPFVRERGTSLAAATKDRMRCGSRVRPNRRVERRCPGPYAARPPRGSSRPSKERSVDEHGAKAGVGVGLQRGVGEAVVRPTLDQSTTVVIPASAAPSNPMKVAAYTSSGRESSPKAADAGEIPLRTPSAWPRFRNRDIEVCRWVSTKPGMTMVSVASTCSASRARPRTDLGDHVFVDEDVGLPVVGVLSPRVHASAADQDLRGHAPPQPSRLKPPTNGSPTVQGHSHLVSASPGAGTAPRGCIRLWCVRIIPP